MQGLGSIYDKSVREEKIAQYLLKDDSLRDDMKKAVMYAKADLLTDMVYEFTELQGLMGYYYAKEAGVDEKIALSYKEQYLPDGEESALPSSDFSAIVALSNKIDSILALFSKGKIPTGTKDPFALRRAVLGIIKIVTDRGFSFDINRDFNTLAKNYDKFDFNLLETFILERISHYFDANPSVIQAVVKSGERDIVEMSKKIEALNEIVENEQFKESFSTFKRVANIIKDMDINATFNVDENLFEKDVESRLFSAYKKVTQNEYNSYKEKLDALFGLKPEIDNFFDHVMVNAEDEKIKNNRKNLIALIYQNFMDIADIKEITI
jgi:glycyl-tRNA synthetase beta chain